jgi:Holliday junction resolvase RusA-like endonuclease
VTPLIPLCTDMEAVPGPPDVLLWPYPACDHDVALYVRFVGLPLGKERPRFGGHAYTSARTRQYEEAVKLLLKKAWPGPPDRLSRFEARAVFRRPDRRRIDGDNLFKAVADAGNGVAYGDDGQVHQFHVAVCFDAEPGFDLLLLRLPPLPPRKRKRPPRKPRKKKPAKDKESSP